MTVVSLPSSRPGSSHAPGSQELPRFGLCMVPALVSGRRSAPRPPVPLAAPAVSAGNGPQVGSEDSPAAPRRDAGYSVLEVVVTMPIVLVLMMLVFQAGTVWYGRSIAQDDAREGLRAAVAFNATASEGKARASDYLQQVAPHALTGPQITVHRSATTVTVQVTATVPALVPFTTFTVHASAAGPVERYRTAP